MKAKYKRIARQQLDNTLSQLSMLKNIHPPPKGWIRAVRDALGMTGKQLARRLLVSQPRVHKLEQDEPSGALTIKTMRQVAEALDCTFVYALIPNTSLSETVKSQAKLIAMAQMQRVSHTMILEAQELSSKEQQAFLENRVKELTEEMPKELWDPVS